MSNGAPTGSTAFVFSFAIFSSETTIGIGSTTLFPNRKLVKAVRPSKIPSGRLWVHF